MTFDPTVSVGNILTVIAILLSAFGLWHKLEVRLTRHDIILEGLIAWKNANGITREAFDDLKDKMKELHHRIRNVEMHAIAKQIEEDKE